MAVATEEIEQKPKEDYLGRTFLNYQSSNEMTPQLMQCFAEFIIKLAQNNVICYNNLQIGKPPGGGCVPGSQNCGGGIEFYILSSLFCSSGAHS